MPCEPKMRAGMLGVPVGWCKCGWETSDNDGRVVRQRMDVHAMEGA